MARTANIENEELKTTEIDMTEAEADEALKADMAANEVDYLAGLLNAAEDAEDETKKIEIVRNGKTYFAFSIHSLPDETLYEIRKKYTKYVKNKRTGTKVAEGVDNAKLRSSMIYNATIAEDAGETGYNPGSQMVQIAGIALLNKLDHYVKEKLHVRYYIRYMDDFWILTHKKSDADYIFREVERSLYKYGLQLNKKKSHVQPLKKGFMFLGFNYRITETGKVIMTLDSKSTKHERKTLVRMVHKEKRMELEPEKTNEHHRSWEDNASKGNSYKLTQRTKTYLKELRKDG